MQIIEFAKNTLNIGLLVTIPIYKIITCKIQKNKMQN